MQGMLTRIEETAELADKAYQRFRQMQTASGMEAENFRATKRELRRRLSSWPRIG
jgi:hypothetical protein